MQYSLNTSTIAPARFPSPFNNQPHALAIEAAQDLQQRLPALTKSLHNFTADGGGKMLGVLVVVDKTGRCCYLAGYSGMLGGHWAAPGFVPPVFDEKNFTSRLESGDHEIKRLDELADRLKNSDNYNAALSSKINIDAQAEHELTVLSQRLQKRKQSRHNARKQQPDNRELLVELAQQSRADKKQRQLLQRQMQELQHAAEARLVPFTEQLDGINKKRRQFSAELQRKLFDCYRIPSYSADTVPLRRLFGNAVPPAGAGDCAAVKLLNAALQQDLTPVCLAEFWWGSDSGLRRHGRFYPSCRSKCRRILPHMLQGLNVTVPVHEVATEFPDNLPETVFEDDSIIVINKPAGMLSVPGQTIEDSVEQRLRQRYPDTDNPMLLLHRLDQATSGLLVAAKNARSYKNLQHQFQRRTINKTYIADVASVTLPDSGEITLPLRVDLEDRPRQIVCFNHGRQALTRFSVLKVAENTSTLAFTPVTGRTHQLRVHAAHPQGLHAPIVGDELYGSPADRLHLHAHTLSFIHPRTQERLSFTVPAPFYPAI